MHSNQSHMLILSVFMTHRAKRSLWDFNIGILAFYIPRRYFERGLRWFHLTLNTMWRRYCSPLLPGYLPASVAGERSNRFAPVSVHRAWTNIFFPTPAGPVSSRARIRGPLSWTHWEPMETRRGSSECSILFLCSHHRSWPLALLSSLILLTLFCTNTVYQITICIHQFNKCNCLKVISGGLRDNLRHNIVVTKKENPLWLQLFKL